MPSRHSWLKSINHIAEDFPCDGLKQVLVCPGLQRTCAVYCVITPRNHDDLRRLKLFPDGATNLKAIRFWHQQVAQDNFRPVSNSEFDSGIAVGGFEDFPLCSCEQIGNLPATTIIVFDD